MLETNEKKGEKKDETNRKHFRQKEPIQTKGILKAHIWVGRRKTAQHATEESFVDRE